MARWFLRWLAACLVACATQTWAEDLSVKLPTVKTTIALGDQPIAVSAAGIITGRRNGLQDLFRLALTADMGDLQNRIADLLRAQLNSDGRCGDRLSVVEATLTPAAPASALAINIHYERWVCVKMLGKDIDRKLVAGDGVIPVTLTPSIAGSDVKLAADVGTIQARGALGEILRSPPVRDRLKERIESSIQSALQGGANLKTMLPPGIERAATLSNARFNDSGSGRLSFELVAEIRMPAAEILALLGH